MDSLQFLQTIFEYAETGFTQVFTLPNKQARALPVDNLNALPTILSEIQPGQNIYFSHGISGQCINERWEASDIIGISSLWVDIDLYNPAAHAKINLPPDIPSALALLPDNLPPSIIVHSGHGLQAWWLLREAWYFDTAEEKQQAADLLERLQWQIRQRATAVGWHLDSVPDLPRVMRLPGTLNMKLPDQPVLAQVIESSDTRYNQSDIGDLLPEIDRTPSSQQRAASFERRPTDGPAVHMLQNCMFMQHCQLNAKTLSYGEWLAALTNIVRATDGIEAAHAVSAMDQARYKPKNTDKKIDECLSTMNPQNCEYIRNNLGFQGCPPGGCGIAAPCGWSLGRVPQAKARIRSIVVPTPEQVYLPATIDDLNILSSQAPAEFDTFFQRCSGQLNKNTLRQEMAKARREQAAAVEDVDSESPITETPADAPSDERFLSKYIPDIPVNLRMPKSNSNYSSWVISKTGAIKIKRVTNTGESYHQVSYSPIFIAERIYNIDSQKEKAVVVFRGNRGGWRSLTLPKSTIFDAKKVMCLADAGLTMNSEIAKNLTQWLSALEACNNDLILHRQGVSKLGWRNHESEFICPGLNNQYVLDVDDAASQKVLSGFGAAGDHAVWVNTMRDMRTRQKARFILAAAFAAPLLKILGQRIFAIFNWGDSRDGKTATLHAALSVWGHPGTLAITANSSQTGIERTAALCTDLPLGINEYEVLTDRKKAEVTDPIIYMLSEGKGRQRGTKDGLQETATWRTITIMNGERPLISENTKGGIITRVLEFHGGPLADNLKFASELYRITDKNHGYAGQIFLDNLLKANHAELQKIYDALRYRLREAYPDKIDAHLDAIACVAVADQLTSMWVFDDDPGTAAATAAAMAEHMIGEMITRDEADESERAWQWLQGWIAANEGRFTLSPRNGMPILGYSESGYLYILKTEIAKAMKAEGYSPEKIFRRWADKERIPWTQLGDKRTFAIRSKVINGVRPWFIRIKLE